MQVGAKLELSLTREEVEEARRRLGREPTLLEWAVIEAEWSEHCSYKSSRQVLKMLPTEGEDVVVGPGFDAGVLSVGDGLVVSIHIESHNHPSAIDPYGGAATGIGGIIRDILSVGSRPIALLNALRFGDITRSGHSAWLFRNVVKGIADYGNCVGIPTVAGEVEFDESFERNCLVDVACIGLGRADRLILPKNISRGDSVILAGNSTGRDGILGASFASKNLDERSEEKRSAVQIPDPFMKKLLLDATLEALDEGIIKAMKDLGGGGLATATVEAADIGGVGIDLDLSAVHLREGDMEPLEVLLSESQERMLYFVGEDALPRMVGKLEKYEVPFSLVGRVKDDGRLTIYWRGEPLADLPTWVAAKAPTISREARRPGYLDAVGEQVAPRPPRSLRAALLRLLSSPNIASKEWVYEQYDHEVGVRTVVKPGRGDAAVLRLPNNRLIAAKLDGDSKKCYLDPYHGAIYVTSEACRNVVATGARPLGIVDHQQFGSPENPEVFWTFMESVRGIADYCRALGLPCVGGKVSFYNEDEATGAAIKPTPVVGIVGLIERAEEVLSMGIKGPGDAIGIIGLTTGEMGGSEYYYWIHRELRGAVPRIDLGVEKAMFRAFLRCNRMGLIKSAHDCSRGGLSVALAEMCIAGGVGASVNLAGLPTSRALMPDEMLFSEGGSRLLVTMSPDSVDEVRSVFEGSGVPFSVIGKSGGGRIRFTLRSKPLIDVDLDAAARSWRRGIAEVMGD